MNMETIFIILVSVVGIISLCAVVTGKSINKDLSNILQEIFIGLIH